MQSKMETVVIPAMTADENNARLDRVFDRLYKLRGSDLKGLADEIENEEPVTHRVDGAEHLFHVATSRMAAELGEGNG